VLDEGTVTHPGARGGDSRTGGSFELAWVVKRRRKFKRVGRRRKSTGQSLRK